jgi:hypothetical protein
LEVTTMSSPEELTLVIGRWLRPIVFVLDIVRRFREAATSSREQVSTARDH